jgi:hypothetical protein
MTVQREMSEFTFLNPLLFEIQGSHGGDYKEYCFLGCDTMQSGRSLVTIWKKLILLACLLSIRLLSMEAACTSEMLVNLCWTTWHYIAKDSTLCCYAIVIKVKELSVIIHKPL